MQRKVAVSGDVSQLVSGNVVHEAPATVHQQNNHVVYNISNPAEPEYLHWHQRRAISAKVDEVAHAEGMDRLAVYRVVLDHHDAKSMKTMPAHRYRAIMDDLVVWLQEAKLRQSAANDTDTAPGTAEQETDRAVATPAATPLSPLRARRGIHALHWALTISAFAACSFLVWHHVQVQASEPAATCQFEGKTYSVGSLAAMPPHGIYECQAATSPIASPSWVPARNLGSAGRRK